MELKDIASVSGKPGLYKIVKPARSAMILETLDEKKQKIIITGNNRLSVLKEISIYTTTKEGTAPLEDILVKIYEMYKETLPVNAASSEKELYSFISEVVPEYDNEKVYPSDLKKLLNWYNLILLHAPEILKSETKSEKKEK
ncbi:MAG TPA: DUF5606 domain-containing protein [Cytophagales bacterium]|nr:DUF5606 domain-containing protein [Cytophagales bacterium]